MGASYSHPRSTLPNYDTDKSGRCRQLQRARELYKLYVKSPGLPAMVLHLPKAEKFSLHYKFCNIEIPLYLSLIYEVIHHKGVFHSLRDISVIYSSSCRFTDLFPIPKSIDGWLLDEEFGAQRINGINHSVIELCTSIPENLQVSDATMQKYLEGMTLDEVMSRKRLFIVNFDILDKLPIRSSYLMCAPIALFFLNNLGNLVPVAIQLYQDPAEDNPVFFPDDPPYTWMLAKMWFNLADASHHQSFSHLGVTHFLMEGVAVTMHRQLAERHPIHKLLLPHFLYNMAINRFGLQTILSSDGFINHAMSIGTVGMFKLIERGMRSWRLDVHGTLPEDLKKRGFENPDVLPGYYFRDDALPLYYAIHDYVSKYVGLYYDDDAEVVNDREIQAWVDQLKKPLVHKGNDDKGGLGIQGIPACLTTRKELILILTSIIFTVSVGHASVNFQQYDEYGYPPEYPALLRGHPPNSKEPKTEQDVLLTLPDKVTVLKTMTAAKLLSTKGTKSLGYFEHQPYKDPNALNVLANFRQRLRRIGIDVINKNKTRITPYPWLHPKNIPNAVSI